MNGKCHCGAPTVRTAGLAIMHPAMDPFFCRDCITVRCDTSDAMPCPIAGVR